MSWRITVGVPGCNGSMVTAYWKRPLSLLTTTKISLDGYTNIELLGESSWTMSKEADWSSIHPIRARLSSSQVEQWIRLLEQVQPCLAPKGVPSHTIRFTQSGSDLTLDLPVWFDVVGPAKIQFEGVWYSVSSEVLEPIRFGLAPFRTSQLLPLALSPTTIKIKVGNNTPLNWSRVHLGQFAATPAPALRDQDLARSSGVEIRWRYSRPRLAGPS